jgi:hypothetical protein
MVGEEVSAKRKSREIIVRRSNGFCRVWKKP